MDNSEAVKNMVDDEGGIVRRSFVLQRLSSHMTAKMLDEVLENTDSLAQVVLTRRSLRRNESVKIIYRPELLEPQVGDQVTDWM